MARAPVPCTAVRALCRGAMHPPKSVTVVDPDGDRFTIRTEEATGPSKVKARDCEEVKRTVVEETTCNGNVPGALLATREVDATHLVDAVPEPPRRILCDIVLLGNKCLPASVTDVDAVAGAFGLVKPVRMRGELKLIIFVIVPT